MYLKTQENIGYTHLIFDIKNRILNQYFLKTMKYTSGFFMRQK